MDANANIVRSGSQPKLSKKAINEMLRSGKNVDNKNRVNFGIAFDIDGVLARGTRALPATREAYELLLDDKGQPKIPVVFVSNSLNRNKDKAAAISNWVGTEIQPGQMVQCQGPLEIFSKFHKKYCLVVGQGKIADIVKELGFTDFCTLDEVDEAYPLLDVVDHENRKRNAMVARVGKDLRRIEAMVLLGEPKKWDQALQLMVDLLVTDGKPDAPPTTMPEVHLPILAANMDLQFMDLACMPRYGHGAFLVCLETLYKKVSGHELKYTALIGKPSEITFRWAEHCLTRDAKRLGITCQMERMYLVGDTPEVDIVGSNLYQRHLDRIHTNISNLELIEDVKDKDKNTNPGYDPELPKSRNVPSDSGKLYQTVKECRSVLVCTGCYNPNQMDLSDIGEDKQSKGHREFPVTTDLYKPTKVVNDVFNAVEYILNKEGV